MMVDFDMSKISAAIKKAAEATYPEYKEPEICDDLYRVFDFLPKMFEDETEEKYIDALQLATETSFYNGLYQFAYVQYHMLFMTAIYYALLQVNRIHRQEFDKALYYLLKDRYSDFYKPSNTKNAKPYFGSFAIINESDVFLLLKIVGMNADLQGQLQKRVEYRNKYVHANGQMLLTSEDIFWDEIREYNRKIEAVFCLLKDDIVTLYKRTISASEFFDPEIRAYLDTDEQIQQEFIKEYSLSREELNWLRKIRLSDFNGLDGESYIKELHLALIHYYKTLDEDDYQPFDDPYVLYKYKDNAAEFVERELEVSALRCGQNGETFPVYECPCCGAEQLAYDADTHRYHCFACDVNYNDEDLSFCSECGCIMLSDEINLCENCIAHKLED